MTISLEKARLIQDDTGSHRQLSSGPVVFTTQTETREQLLAITRSAERLLSIWSTDLCKGLLENQCFLDALKKFVLARRHARVRVLTRTAPAAEQAKQALLVMAERLPASIEVRTLNTSQFDAGELVLADERGVLYRIHVERWDGMADLNDPLVNRFYLAQFDAAWRAASPLTPTTELTPH